MTTEVNGQVTVKEGYNNLPDHDASIDDTLDRRLVCINTLLEEPGGTAGGKDDCLGSIDDNAVGYHEHRRRGPLRSR